MPEMIISIIFLTVSAEITAAVMRRYFPAVQGARFSWIIRTIAWVLGGWGVIVILTTDPNARNITTPVMTLTALMMLSALYGCVSSAGLTAMAINYLRVPSGRKRAITIFAYAIGALLVGIAPWFIVVNFS